MRIGMWVRHKGVTGIVATVSIEEDGRRRPLGRHEIATGPVTAEVHVVNADGATVEVRHVPARDLRQARFNEIPKARREGKGAAPRIVFSRLGYG